MPFCKHIFCLVGWCHLLPDVGPGSNRWIFFWDRGIHWIHLDLSDISSSGWGQDGRQRHQHPNCAGPHLGPWRVWWRPPGNKKCHLAMVVLGEWRVNLGQHCFCYCRIIDSTNKMAIIPSRENDQNIPPRSCSKVPDLVGVPCDHSLEGTPNGAMIFNVASHLLVLANGTHATTTGCVQKFQHQCFKRPGGSGLQGT